MASGIIARKSSERVSEIVDRTKVLSERLRCAIIHLDNLTKDCFDTNATELSKTVESIRKSYVKLTEEHDAVKEEVKVGEKRLEETLNAIQQLEEENAKLMEMESNFFNSQSLADEHRKVANELRMTLKTYKQLTGVRFDFNEPTEVLTGYVGIVGDKPSNCTIVPFEVNKTDDRIKDLLWEKIQEACDDVSQC